MCVLNWIAAGRTSAATARLASCETLTQSLLFCFFLCSLHYGARGKAGFLEDIALVKQWRAKRGAAGRPQMVWMDVPLQVIRSGGRAV